MQSSKSSESPFKMVQILRNNFGTSIHIDRYASSMRQIGFKVWIPLSDIDNLSLGVGDISAYHFDCLYHHHHECDKISAFKSIAWYHQPIMRRQDVIFFSSDKALKDVPHFSLHRGPECETQQRESMVMTVRLLVERSTE